MAKEKKQGKKELEFRDKLVLNQWLFTQFGLNPLRKYRVDGKEVRPLHKLAEGMRSRQMEGLRAEGLHKFYYQLVESELFRDDFTPLKSAQIMRYEENIVRHTRRLNEKRETKDQITWKYFQWLCLLFTEVYLDAYFRDAVGLLESLNSYVTEFNKHYSEYADVPEFKMDDLNMVCFQNATGSGKTLLMHVHLMQYQHYAEEAQRKAELSRVILLTPNDSLSTQHVTELKQSGINAQLLRGQINLFAQAKGLTRVDVIEITKLGEKDGPNTVAVRNLGGQNLLLVDEGHRGLSGKEEGVWLGRRRELCSEGFCMEYSATFDQAVGGAASSELSSYYARSVLFDYSYRYFYEDGFGKDYQILNMPATLDIVEKEYMTACLLKYFQQLYLYDLFEKEYAAFQIEKPLWVFVGHTVNPSAKTADDRAALSDVGKIIGFLADFLTDRKGYVSRIDRLIRSGGKDTGLIDAGGIDIFDRAFLHLGELFKNGATAETLMDDILSRVFQHRAGGSLKLQQIKGNADEVALRVGTSEKPFGLIYVGSAATLVRHCIEHIPSIEEEEDEFAEPLFATVKSSSSSVNLLVGAKKFVEGWDCWRVSTMGLMHVGKSEGSQIIQLFGRGVRLKGYQRSLRRSGHAGAGKIPHGIEEVETLNVFGIEADFMQKFREYLQTEGLPGNERRHIVTIPLNVTYDVGKGLKVLRPKKRNDGKEYDFKSHGPVPTLGNVPDAMKKFRVQSDWYPRIQSLGSVSKTAEAVKESVKLQEKHVAFVKWDMLWLALERYKSEKGWYNLNIPLRVLRPLVLDASWYDLKLPGALLNPQSVREAQQMQEVVLELLKLHCERLYNYHKRAYIEPRLELRALTLDDDNLNGLTEYQLVVDGSETALIDSLNTLVSELAAEREKLTGVRDLHVLRFASHLYRPLFHVAKGGKVQVMPVRLNDSEYAFVEGLINWCEGNATALATAGEEVYLLRNLSRGKGMGFFEAGGFYPDFLLWVVSGDHQRLVFVDPHGLHHEGIGSEKIRFASKIKEIERRIVTDGKTRLESYILSPTRLFEVTTRWKMTVEELREAHVLFMQEDAPGYYGELVWGLQK